MSISYAERRQVENEMIFRRQNEKVSNGLAELDAMHAEDGNVALIQGADMELHFRCECSDEDCKTGIPMTIAEYQEIHTDRDTFVILPDHQVDTIEKVFKKTAKYFVVKKNYVLAEPSNQLNETSIHNT